jgi:hypothetical protein
MGAAFQRVIELQLRQYGPEEAKRRHIEIARRGLAAFLARQSSKPIVTIEVDGRPAQSETEVMPYGRIVYHFIRMPQIAAFCLDQAIRLSPVHTGQFRHGWFVLEGETQVDPKDVRGGFIMVNDEPYARKIHVGSKGYEKYANPGIVEKVRQLAFRRYGATIDAEIEFITLQGGYILKGRAPRVLAKTNSRSSAFRGGRKFLAARPDRGPGAEMTYPALVVTAKQFAP